MHGDLSRHISAGYAIVAIFIIQAVIQAAIKAAAAC